VPYDVMNLIAKGFGKHDRLADEVAMASDTTYEVTYEVPSGEIWIVRAVVVESPGDSGSYAYVWAIMSGGSYGVRIAVATAGGRDVVSDLFLPLKEGDKIYIKAYNASGVQQYLLYMIGITKIKV